MADRSKLTLDVIDLSGTGTCTEGLGEILSQLSSAEIPGVQDHATPSADSSEPCSTASPTQSTTARPVIIINLVSPVRGSPEERKASVMTRLSRKLSIKKAVLQEKAAQVKKARIKKEKQTRTGALHVRCACDGRM